jgi:hypothetical protein
MTRDYSVSVVNSSKSAMRDRSSYIFVSQISTSGELLFAN